MDTSSLKKIKSFSWAFSHCSIRFKRDQNKNQRLSPERRVAQVGKLREAKQAGKIAYFVLDRLVIRDKKIPPNQDV